MTGYQSKKAAASAKTIEEVNWADHEPDGKKAAARDKVSHMTWVFLTDAERNKISHKAVPYIVNSYEPHEAAVRQRNPRDNWKGLTEEQRSAIATGMPKPFFVKDLLAAIEIKLQEQNNG